MPGCLIFILAIIFMRSHWTIIDADWVLKNPLRIWNINVHLVCVCAIEPNARMIAPFVYSRFSKTVNWQLLIGSVYLYSKLVVGGVFV